MGGALCASIKVSIRSCHSAKYEFCQFFVYLFSHELRADRVNWWFGRNSIRFSEIKMLKCTRQQSCHWFGQNRCGIFNGTNSGKLLNMHANECVVNAMRTRRSDQKQNARKQQVTPMTVNFLLISLICKLRIAHMLVASCCHASNAVVCAGTSSQVDTQCCCVDLQCAKLLRTRFCLLHFDDAFWSHRINTWNLLRRFERYT